MERNSLSDQPRREMELGSVDEQVIEPKLSRAMEMTVDAVVSSLSNTFRQPNTSYMMVSKC